MKKILLLCIFTFPSFSQDNDSFSKIFELMEARMKKAFDSFFADDDNLDQMLGMGKDIFENSSIGGMLKKDFEYTWEQGVKGRTLVIKVPENNQVNVDIKNESVKVTGQVKVEKTNKTQYGTSKSVSIQSIQEAFPVPKDCTSKASKVTEIKKDKKVITSIFFPYKNGKAGDPGILHSQQSIDFPDIKELKKSFPRPQFSNKTKKLPPKAKKNNQTSEEDMIPLFDDGKEI